MGVLMNERDSAPKDILLEGGPGQGKSTISQMAAQVYRAAILGGPDLDAEGRWKALEKSRVPIRLDLRGLAEWLGADSTRTVDAYVASVISQDSGGREVKVEDLHDVASKTPLLIIFDGLDEIGSEEIRDLVLSRIAELTVRLRDGLDCDLRTVITTRPPAIAGRRQQIPHFSRFPLAPLTDRQVDDFLDRWLSVQFLDQQEGNFVRTSFTRRRSEPHVSALSTNPMQLSVLLHFIRLKGEAFPDRRADLYREYFRTVIDRDVEKSAKLRQNRESIETLHELIGFKIHMLTEAGKADGSLPRQQLLRIVADWLASQSAGVISAEELFAVGEERLGLIAALRGEGQHAQYGYEIQPIREYFAAAFINEQIQGDAHEVFPVLVRRSSYWREVALFLAGLRRPNERADLLSRARDLDNDHGFGWRQDGRTIILHLMQEGVLSQPRHVYADALSFLLGAVDPREPCGRHEPKELLPALPGLVRAGDFEPHLGQILGTLADGMRVGDEYKSLRILGLVTQLLDAGAARRTVMAYRVPSLPMLGRVRLLWSLRFGVDLRVDAEDQAFWEDRDGALWARPLWAAAMFDDRATGLRFPPSYHARLVEELVFNPLPVGRARSRVLRPASDYAVWRLAANQQMMAALLGRVTARRLESVIGETAAGDCSFVGLPDHLEGALRLLIARSAEVLMALRSGGRATAEMEGYVAAIREMLARPGLESWLGWRSFSSLARGLARRATPPEALSAHLIRDSAWDSLNREVARMFGLPDSTDASTLGKASLGVPYYVAASDGQSYPLWKLLVGHWAGGECLPFDWVARIPLSWQLVRSVVRGAAGKLGPVEFDTPAWPTSII